MNIEETPQGEPRLFQTETLVHMFLSDLLLTPYGKTL